MLHQETCINLSLPRHHILNFTQTIFMVLHQSKVGFVVPFQSIMEECYPKKDANPEIVNSEGSPVFGFLTVNECSSLGVDSKNS